MFCKGLLKSWQWQTYHLVVQLIETDSDWKFDIFPQLFLGQNLLSHWFHKQHTVQSACCHHHNIIIGSVFLSCN